MNKIEKHKFITNYIEKCIKDNKIIERNKINYEIDGKNFFFQIITFYLLSSFHSKTNLGIIKNLENAIINTVALLHFSDDKEIDIILKDFTKTYKNKNEAYGNSFSRVWHEEGKYKTAIIRLKDKLYRFEALKNGANNNVKDESIIDTLKDLCNYCIMSIIELQS